MTDLSLLRQIVEANQSFLAGTPRFLDPTGAPFVVVTCIDPRLTCLIEPALGLPRQRAAIIRTAGNQISDRTPDTLRSLAAALYVKNATEIIIVGHTDCGMAGFSVSEVTEHFRKSGIPRHAFGNEDLRTWFGAFASVRNNVITTVDYLHHGAILPRAIKIHGLILETNQGAVEVVIDGDLASQGGALPALETEPSGTAATAGQAIPSDEPSALPPEKSQPAAPSSPTSGSRTGKGPIIVGSPPAGLRGDQAPPPPNSLIDAALVIRDFISRERRDQKLQRSINELKTVWKQQKNPLRIFSELERIAMAYEKDYPSLRGALLYLENAVRSGKADANGVSEVMRRFLD